MLTAGYDSEMEIDLVGLEEIGPGAQFRAAVKSNALEATPLVTLSTAAGTIQRVSSVLQTSGANSGKWVTRFRFKFAASVTETWGGATKFLDVARIDVPPPDYLGIFVSMKWHQPITTRAIAEGV